MVDKIPAMVSMARATETEKESAPTVADAPTYPYGLCISLCNDELDKLGIDCGELVPGDILHLHCLGMVTSTSINQRQEGMPDCRVEIQITNIAAESEDDENEEEEAAEKPNRLSKFYK